MKSRASWKLEGRHIISYEVIRHEIEPSRSILEKYI